METLRTFPETLSGGEYFPGVRYSGGGVIAVRMPNWLGDAVMALPALRQLRLGGWRTVAVAPAGVAGLLDLFDCVESAVILPEAHRNWPDEVLTQLRESGADFGLLLTNSPRDAIYFRRAGIRRLFGAAARGRSLLLEGAFKFPWNRRGCVGDLHHARKYSLMAEALGGSAWDGKFPENKLGDELPCGVAAGSPLLVLAPGAAYGAAKRWPSNSFANTGRRFLSDYAAGRIVIVGGRGESAIASEVAGQLGTDERVINLCGRTTLAELAAILKLADACVANDSGTMHLSASVGGSGVAVFGSTDWVVTAPLSSKWRIVRSSWGCAPCFRRTCTLADEPLCMRSINSEHVYMALKELLHQG